MTSANKGAQNGLVVSTGGPKNRLQCKDTVKGDDSLSQFYSEMASYQAIAGVM